MYLLHAVVATVTAGMIAHHATTLFVGQGLLRHRQLILRGLLELQSVVFSATALCQQLCLRRAHLCDFGLQACFRGGQLLLETLFQLTDLLTGL